MGRNEGLGEAVAFLLQRARKLKTEAAASPIRSSRTHLMIHDAQTLEHAAADLRKMIPPGPKPLQ